MSVTFTTDRPIVGRTITCPFDNRVFGSYDEALQALSEHNHQGQFTPCAAYLEWAAQFGDDREALGDALVAHNREHGVWLDICESGTFTDVAYAEQSPSVNVSNTNAYVLLEALGFLSDETERTGEELSGTCDAESFLGRILVAQAISPSDAGTPAQEYFGARGARVLDFGRPEGYVDERLVALHELAQWAYGRGLAVMWS